MPPPIKSIKPAFGGKISEDSETPCNNLWVGNLSTDVTETDLMNLFSKHGVVDSITSYASRSYAFVYFKRVEDAKAAVQALRGSVLRGQSLKIEFAKPAKPCKSLWVSGISPSITKEALEEEFLKFGKIEEFKFIRDRNTAYVDYFRLEDASQALKSMNGKRIGGDQIRVDFLRSHTSKKEQWADYHDAREGQFFSRGGLPDSLWMAQDISRRQQLSGGQTADGHPSNVLWIRYPPAVHIDEQMLHNAMILFGEIERIKSFPSRNYSFVEFRSVDEARRAKEGLQGRLFNDPRITIMYSSSELAHGKDYPGLYQGVKGSGPDLVFDESTFPTALMDVFSHSRPMLPNALSGPAQSSGILGPNMLIRPFGSQSGLNPLLSGPELHDLAVLHKMPDANPKSLMGGPNWRRSSPAPEMIPSPTLGLKRPGKPVSSGWDVFDANQLQRESKRSRIDTILPVNDSFPSRQVDDSSLGLDRLYGLGPHTDAGTSGVGLLGNAQEKNRFSPAEFRTKMPRIGQGHPDRDYVWRGVIAKGGTPVCRARCVPIGKGIQSEIPEVVNCSARTGLDMLTKHYADAIGFDIVFFLPDSEEDFASYTEFLRYLGTRDRAGVAKFDDGTTLFLVPPSDFLTKVLNVAGPERLYGVVLKFPQHAPASTSVQPQSYQSHYVDGHQVPAQIEYSGVPQEDKLLQMDYNRVSHEDSLPPPKQLAVPPTDSVAMHPTPSVNTAAVSQTGVTLTPELIATLASLLPVNTKSSGSESAQPQLGPSSMGLPLPPRTELDRGLQPQGFAQDHKGSEQISHPIHHVENQYNPQRQQVSHLQTYPSGLNASSSSALGMRGNSQPQDPTFHLPQQSAVSSRPSNFGISSQSGHLSVSPQIDQQCQYEVSQNAQKYGMSHGTESVASYGSSVYQQPAKTLTLPNQVHDSDMVHHNTVMPLGAEKGNSDLPGQVQQLQPGIYGASQGTSALEADKNQRYQSTLQFAANLLLQIQQQQQQQTGTQSGQGSASH